MADDAGVIEDTPITFTVKSSTDAKFTFTLPATTSVSDLKEKLSTSEYADTPVDRQRLIYSGRVLKDTETLQTYKIKDGHTIHLVKSAASNQQRGNTSSQSSSATASSGAAANQPAAGVPTNLAAGTGNNPLAGLTGARYAGFAQLPGAGLFGPDGGMGPPPDTESMLNMLENPQFQSTINEALQNPAMIDMMIQQNPMLRDMGPGMMQMQRAMGMGGGLGGESAFPAPGVTDTTPEANQPNQQQNAAANPFGQFPPNPLGNPFASLFGGNAGANPFAPPASATTGNAQPEGNANTSNNIDRSTSGDTPTTQAPPNPFAALLNPALFGGAGQGQGQTGTNPFNPQQNPFLRDPALMAQMMQAMGGQGAEGGAAANPMAALFGGGGGGFGSPHQPTTDLQKRDMLTSCAS
ncbi:hypothetical protein N7470_005495 [Penicillium chermesinum]|nr:hypothetical protein N7470_005495 [Penicillium chermesinum]